MYNPNKYKRIKNMKKITILSIVTASLLLIGLDREKLKILMENQLKLNKKV